LLYMSVNTLLHHKSRPVPYRDRHLEHVRLIHVTLMPCRKATFQIAFVNKK